ncbi:MotA/TolQ/ExbB proton channel family protein [Maioricimonas sp. JC845]|uniref:MotA/TolQ/ExbB proton channel family protein n=1 Tax=Maioricimonas sp. JC845 TaxID=3232138 RepID=UPI0034576C3D
MSWSQRPALQGWASLMVVALLVSSLGAYVAPTPLFAQDDGEAAAAEEGTPADDTAAEAPADGDGGDASDDEDAPQESFLAWMIRASGMFGVVLLLLSFIMVAVIMMNVLQVRRDNLLPPAFIEAFEQKLAAKDYQGAYETARSDDSFIARVLAAGLGKLNRGYQEAIEGMQEVGEEESMTMEHRLSYLALIGSIAPMIGLMGTVYGMINSFSEIATSPVQPKPKDLADGIATALFTTLEGLTVAIPALIAYSLLRNRVARFVLEVGMVSEGLMSRFSTVGKQKSGGAAVATAPAKPADE